MKLLNESMKKTIRRSIREESEYQKYFKKELEKAGEDLDEMSDDEKKEFFNKIDRGWKAKNESKTNITMKSTIRQLVREEIARMKGNTDWMFESDIRSDFEKVYSIFDKKDYFETKDIIKHKLANWQYALDRGDKGAEQYTKQDVIDHVISSTKAHAKNVYDQLVQAINKKDIKTLKSKLRYDQPFSIAIFTQVTGIKLPKSTKAIHSFLDNEFIKY